jgi:hypothetical protein
LAPWNGEIAYNQGMRYFLLVFMVFITSCGEDALVADSRRNTSANSGGAGGFGSYLQEFNSYYYQYQGRRLDLASVDIQMVDEIPGSSGSAVGSCNYGSRKIKILRSYWNRAGETSRKLTVFHELGHCYLRRGHTSTVIDGVPVSIMYPTLAMESFYSYYQREYLEELFTGNTAQFEAVARYVPIRNLNEANKVHPHFCNHEHHDHR